MNDEAPLYEISLCPPQPAPAEYPWKLAKSRPVTSILQLQPADSCISLRSIESDQRDCSFNLPFVMIANPDIQWSLIRSNCYIRFLRVLEMTMVKRSLCRADPPSNIHPCSALVSSTPSEASDWEGTSCWSQRIITGAGTVSHLHLSIWQVTVDQTAASEYPHSPLARMIS